MKSKLVMTFYAFLVSIAGLAVACAQDEEKLFWYEISIVHGSKPYEFYGSSPLSADEFITEMSKQRFVRLDNLMFRTKSENESSGTDKSVYKGWKEWDPLKKTYIYLNLNYVIAVHPLDRRPETKNQKKPE